ncbi:MAG: hypothetical protein ACKO38_00180 [Planctomycetota bacterium]
MAGRIWFARIVVVVGLLGAGVSGGANPVRAELSDEEYKKLRTEATELLHLRIGDITVVDSKPEMVKYRVEATVDQVDRSARGFSRGARLTFDSYYVPTKARKGYTGPESPPQLYPGWTGWIFLGKSKAGNGLEPAAHGRSFHYSYDLKP